MNTLLTIGVTTYNNEPYLLELFHSIESNISEENFRDIEIIFSDDFSSDKSIELIKTWIEKIGEKIKTSIYYSKDNSGSPSSGRNKMIENAQGKYLMFLDGDDLIIDNLDNLLDQIRANQKYGIDAYVSNVKRYDNGKIMYSPMPHSKELFNANNFNAVYRHIVYQAGIWWIYNVNFLRENNILYDEGIRYEDAIFNFKVFCKSPTIRKACINYYGWRVNRNSFSRNNVGEILNNRIIQLEYYRDHFKEMPNNSVKDELKVYIFRIVIGQYLKGHFDISFKEMKEFFEIITNQQNKKFLRSIKVKRRIRNNKILTLTQISITNKYVSSVLFYTINKINYINKNRARFKIKYLSKLFSKLIKTSEKEIFMEGFYGEYNDNIKALCDRMVERGLHKEYKINLSLKNTHIKLDANINKIDYMNKYKYIYRFYRSKYVFLNTWYNQDMLKSDNQTFIQLWHGTPIKKMYTDEAYYDVKYDETYKQIKDSGVRRWDYVVAQNDYNFKCFTKLFPHAEILKVGYPRTDYLVQNKDNIKLKKQLKKKYNINHEFKIIMYMPTFRSYKYVYNLNSILENLQENELLVIRKHPLDISKLHYEEEYSNKVIELTNGYIDTNEILLIADKLISDYSSAMVDFKQISDNVQFYTTEEDIELYDKTQGLYTRDVQHLINSAELIEYSDVNSADLIIDKILGLN